MAALSNTKWFSYIQLRKVNGYDLKLIFVQKLSCGWETVQKCNVILILINDNLVFVALKLKKSQQ